VTTASSSTFSPTDATSNRSVPTADLLRAFIAHRDEPAFAALVHRYGPVVLGVCRRVTGNAADADDAFQATFLVLAKKAHKVRPPEQLGAWLYGVAYRTALKARAVAARRREGERRVAQMNVDSTNPDRDWHDLRPVLDEELNRLPARYRAAIVACDFEGKSRHDAAAGLAINEGTLSSRLSRGRELLAARLTRRGVALSAAAVVSLIGSNAATAAPAAALVATTASAAVSFATGGVVAAGVVSAKAAVLSEGVLHAMFITKAKIVASLIVAATLTGTGVAVVTQYAIAADKAAKAKADNAAGKFKGDKADYVQPDASGTVTDVAQDGKQITILTGKASKTEPATSATVQLTAATDITFSAIGPDGDKVAPGFQAQVWFEPNSNTKASRIAYAGQQSQKDTRQADVAGRIVSVTADGKKLSIEPRPQAQKGAKGEKTDPPAKGEKGDKAGAITEVAITPQTQATFSAVTTGAANFKEGYDVQVYYDPKTPGAAAMIRVTGPEGAAMKGVDRGAVDLSGRVAGIVPDGRSVALEVRPEVKKGEDKNAGGPKVKVEEPLQQVNVPITPATKVIYNGVPLNGATPTVDYHANVWLDGTAAKTIHFDAVSREKRGPDLSSQVLAVTPDGKRITVALQPKEKFGNPEERDIDISAAKIIFNNVHPGEAKPQEGYQVQVWLDPKAQGTATVATFSPGKIKQ
jgi:RNA polymerase sigma factor (sigma-70 family)